MDLLTEHESYQDLAWSVGVRLRGNLDKIYTWAEKYGLAQDFRKVNLKLSEAADLASDSKFNYRKIILYDSYRPPNEVILIFSFLKLIIM